MKKCFSRQILFLMMAFSFFLFRPLLAYADDPVTLTFISPAVDPVKGNSVLIEVGVTTTGTVVPWLWVTTGSKDPGAWMQQSNPRKMIWDTTKLPNGPTKITVTAWDVDAHKQLTTIEKNVTIQNDDIVPPLVSFMTPPNGGAIDGKVTVIVKMIELNPDRVEISLNGQPLQTVLDANDFNYHAMWDASQEQEGAADTLVATGYDKSGNQTSAQVQVKVHHVINYDVKLYSVTANGDVLINKGDTLRGMATVKAVVDPNKGYDKVNMWLDPLVSWGFKAQDLYQAKWDTTQLKDGPTYYIKVGLAEKNNDFFVMEMPIHVDNSIQPMDPNNVDQPGPAPHVPNAVMPASPKILQPSPAPWYEIAQVKLNSENLEDVSRTMPFEDLNGKGVSLTGNIKGVESLDHVEVSLDGGSQWQKIEPKAQWSFHFNPVPNQDYNIQLRAVQKDGKTVDLPSAKARFRYTQPARSESTAGFSSARSAMSDISTDSRRTISDSLSSTTGAVAASNDAAVDTTPTSSHKTATGQVSTGPAAMTEKRTF